MGNVLNTNLYDYHGPSNIRYRRHVRGFFSYCHFAISWASYFLYQMCIAQERVRLTNLSLTEKFVSGQRVGEKRPFHFFQTARRIGLNFCVEHQVTG